MNELFFEVLVEGKTEELDIILATVSEAMTIEGVEEADSQLRFYFRNTDFDETEFRNLVEVYKVKYSISKVFNQNWNAIWESGFQPVTVDNFASIRADFHQPNPAVAYEIVITPKMSFGTGHHATTYMMIKMLKQFDPAGKTVIDFGTGTGVLAILAAKMKASRVLGIDYDPWSISNAAENIETNNTPIVELLQKDHFPPDIPPVALILANINRNVIIDNLPALTEGVLLNGILIISGILNTDIPEMTELIQSAGFRLLNEFSENNWACLAFKKELIKA